MSGVRELGHPDTRFLAGGVGDPAEGAPGPQAEHALVGGVARHQDLVPLVEGDDPRRVQVAADLGELAAPPQGGPAVH
jgi:hypothetical protein